MSYRHLSAFERGKIQACLHEGLTRIEIAERLERSPATIGRELARNSTRYGYLAEHAQEQYEHRRQACRPRSKMEHKPLLDYVSQKIREEEWTPEIVAHRLPLDFPDDPTMRVSHETIYRELYARHHLLFLVACLPQARAKRRKRGQGKTRRGPSIPNRIGIEHRPAQVEARIEHGHLEGDTIVGKHQDSFIVTLVERTSRWLHAVEVLTKNAAHVADAIIETLLDWPTSWVKTITFDNGTEFACHERIARELNVDIYFADPYASYQRGSNEQANGLIRRSLPKGTCFKSLRPNQLQNIIHLLNNRPRKCLGYRTPNEVFQKQRQEHLIALRA